MLLLVLGLALLEATGSRLLRYAWDVGPPLPVVDGNLLATVLSLGVLAGAWLVLTREGVTVPEIGLSPRLVVPATVTVAGYFLVLNAVGAGFAIATGAPETIGYHWTVPPAEAIVIFLWMLVVAGLVEEFLFRGYLQTKCIAILGGDRRTRIGLGIVVVGVLFAAYHVPRILVDGPPGAMSPLEYLALLTVNGIAFGLLYEWTHNLFVPILVHAAGNMPGTAGILFFTTAGWAPWAFVGYQVVYVGLVIGMILGYRRVAGRTGWMPVWTERTLAEDPADGG